MNTQTTADQTAAVRAENLQRNIRASHAETDLNLPEALQHISRAKELYDAMDGINHARCEEVVRPSLMQFLLGQSSILNKKNQTLVLRRVCWMLQTVTRSVVISETRSEIKRTEHLAEVARLYLAEIGEA